MILFLIESSLDLQVMRTVIKSWLSLTLGQIGLFTRESFAFSFSLTYNGEIMSGQQQLHF